MTLDIVPLHKKHLSAAAEIAAGRIRALRAGEPLLPAAYTQPETLLPLLQAIHQAGPAAAALESGQLVGWLAAWQLPEINGRPAAFSPEWANGALDPGAGRITDELYTHMARVWVKTGYHSHYISLLACDRPGRETWHWLGFGLVAVDALRALWPRPAHDARIAIRRAAPADLPAVLSLDRALDRHIASSPSFFPLEGDETAHFEEWLAAGDRALFLAEEAGEPAGFVMIGPASQEACTLINDPGTASIVGAYTRPESRDRGVATALLDRALGWARDANYLRCGVDFESMNHWATRFWLRHFRPVVLSVVRHIVPPPEESLL